MNNDPQMTGTAPCVRRKVGGLRSGSATRVRRTGATLVEVALAVGLLVALSSMTFWFYESAWNTRERGTAEARKLQLARVVLDRIGAEIRQAAQTAPGEPAGIRGDAERIWLLSHRVPSRELARERRSREQPPPGEYDRVKVSYRIARHPEVLHDDGWELPLGLARVEIRVPRPDTAETGEAFEDKKRITGGRTQEEENELLEIEVTEQELSQEEGEPDRDRVEEQIRWEELYAPDIRYLRFCYHDGNRWWDNWQVTGENPLPQLVMVTIGFEALPPLDAVNDVEDEQKDFCTCLNRDPPDCAPLPGDQFQTVVRVAQADSLFRSRVTRETQAAIEDLRADEEEQESGQEPDEAETDGGSP